MPTIRMNCCAAVVAVLATGPFPGPTVAGQPAAARHPNVVIILAAGYATGCFGKWHNGTQWPLHPRARGFDTFYGFTEGHWGDYHDAEMELDGRFVKGAGYIADDITDKAIGFVERPAGSTVTRSSSSSPTTVPTTAAGAAGCGAARARPTTAVCGACAASGCRAGSLPAPASRRSRGRSTCCPRSAGSPAF
jgi:hypothetical protein